MTGTTDTEAMLSETLEEQLRIFRDNATKSLIHDGAVQKLKAYQLC